MSRQLFRRKVRIESRKVNSPRVFYGVLGEDYDGIGQYVMVTTARSANSAAYKVRVASGDFGTNQVIPAGTLVTVLSQRGRLQVVSLGAK